MQTVLNSLVLFKGRIAPLRQVEDIFGFTAEAEK